MCSSPKSSVSIPKSSTRSIFASMDPETRKRFVETANKAQERKEQRLARQKQLKSAKEKSRGNTDNTATGKNKLNVKQKAKQKAKQHSGLLTMLSAIGFSV